MKFVTEINNLNDGRRFQSSLFCVAGVKLKSNDIALHAKSSQSYEASLAIWDHTVLPSTRHK